MSNQKYAQFMTLLAAGRFNWQTDMIEARLVTGATFNADDLTLSQVGTAVGTASITGRITYGQAFLGDPAFFPNAEADQALPGGAHAERRQRGPQRDCLV